MKKRNLKRRALIGRDGPGCSSCGVVKPRKRGGTSLTLDHILPVSEGGTGVLENLRLMCRPCQDERHGISRTSYPPRHPEDWPWKPLGEMAER